MEITEVEDLGNNIYLINGTDRVYSPNMSSAIHKYNKVHNIREKKNETNERNKQKS